MTTAESPAETLALSLIDRSISHDEVARHEWTAELAEELLVLAYDSEEDGSELAYWGGEGEGEWRVHLTGPRVDVEDTRQALLDRALDRIDVSHGDEVTKIEDDVDTVTCQRSEWDAMVRRVLAGEVRLTGPAADDDDASGDYTTVICAIRGPLLSHVGSSRGTPEERQRLATHAHAEWGVDTAHLYGIAPEGRTEDAWWAWHDQDHSRWSQTTDEAEERCRDWVAGETTDGPAEDGQ